MTLLDWRDRDHWSATPRPCRHCGLLTHLRNDDDLAAHKGCEEGQGTI